MSRETIATAIFALLNTVTMQATFKEISRRPKLWEQATVKPCLFLAQPEDDVVHKNGTATPGETTMDFDVIVYIDTGLDPNTVPDTLVNNCIDLIEAAIAPPNPLQAQTLGGLVNRTWIDGQITRVPGYIDGRGIIFMTIRVLVP